MSELICILACMERIKPDGLVRTITMPGRILTPEEAEQFKLPRETEAKVRRELAEILEAQRRAEFDSRFYFVG